jgi:hypothetical protein
MGKLQGKVAVVTVTRCLLRCQLGRVSSLASTLPRPIAWPRSFNRSKQCGWRET